MHQHWTCSCGHMVHADAEEDLVRKAQEHMRKDHGKEISREDVVKAAQAGQH